MSLFSELHHIFDRERRLRAELGNSALERPLGDQFPLPEYKSCPMVNTQELAQKMLDIISETRTTAIPLIIGREPDEYRHDVMIHFGEGLNKLEGLCKEQLQKEHEVQPEENEPHAQFINLLGGEGILQ